MTQRDKLIRRFLAEPPEIDFGDVCTLLSWFGYEEREASGSHHYFERPGGPRISVPVVSGRKVKRTYIKRIVEILGLDEY